MAASAANKLPVSPSTTTTMPNTISSNYVSKNWNAPIVRVLCLWCIRGRFKKHRLDKDSQPYNRTRFMFNGLIMIEWIKLTHRKARTCIVTPTAMNRWRE